MKQFISNEFLAYRKQVFALLIGLIVGFVSPVKGVSAQQADGALVQKDMQASAEAGISPERVAALEKRVENLEQQIVDLRTMLGTFASMGRGGTGLVRNPRRSDRPLAAQDGAAQVRRGQLGEAFPPRQQRSVGANVQGPQIAAPLPPVRPDIREDGVVADGSGVRGEESGLPGQAIVSGDEPAQGPQRRQQGPQQNPMKKASASAQVPSGTRDAQSLYNDAYSHMLRRDYASAQNAFGSLIKTYPQSRMAGNAQYWLGETFYVRGKYRPAADAFLKAYRNYSKSIKAPDSLMKLAFSLGRLGQKGAACKTFDELDVKFPNAPNHVKQRAGMERRRMGCN